MLQSLVHVCLAGSHGNVHLAGCQRTDLIFGVLRVLNFAHGSFYMLGAYVCFTVLKYMAAILARAYIRSVGRGCCRILNGAISAQVRLSFGTPVPTPADIRDVLIFDDTSK